MLALYAAIERDFTATFAWLGLAIFIDGVDGTLARAARVTEVAATIDGVILDLVVDFLSYVLVPIVAIWRSDLMPTPLAFWIGLVVVSLSVVWALATFLILTNLTPIAPREELVYVVLFVNLLLVIAMVAVIAVHIVGLWRAWAKKVAGARLHARVEDLAG